MSLIEPGRLRLNCSVGGGPPGLIAMSMEATDLVFSAFDVKVAAFTFNLIPALGGAAWVGLCRLVGLHRRRAWSPRTTSRFCA